MGKQGDIGLGITDIVIATLAEALLKRGQFLLANQVGDAITGKYAVEDAEVWATRSASTASAPVAR